MTDLIKERISQQGGELRWISLSGQKSVAPGWLPDDDLTQEWLEHIREYREKCDKEDRERILGES